MKELKEKNLFQKEIYWIIKKLKEKEEKKIKIYMTDVEYLLGIFL